MIYPKFKANNFKEWFQQLIDNYVFWNLEYDIPKLNIYRHALEDEFILTKAGKLSKLKEKLTLPNHIAFGALIECYVAYKLNRISKEDVLNLCPNGLSAAQLRNLNTQFFKKFNLLEMVDYLIKEGLLTNQQIAEYQEYFLELYPNNEIKSELDLQQKFVDNLLGITKNIKVVNIVTSREVECKLEYILQYLPTNEYLKIVLDKNSYGCELEDLYLVRPVEVMITEYINIVD